MNIIERAQQLTDGAKIIASWLGDGALTVPHRQAQARADVCLKCQMNVKDYAFTEAVAIAVREQVGIKNKLNLRVNGEKSLHSCSGCGCALRLKVWLPIDRLGLDAAELEKFPAHCWQVTEPKEFKK